MVVNNRESWERAKEECPGMDQGELHTQVEIEAVLDSQSATKILTRNDKTRRSV
jgi:hypothetical protein